MQKRPVSCRRYLFLIATGAFLLFACNAVYTSKKNGYFRIDLPEHRYREFRKDSFPYTFEYPVYADVIHDSTFFDRNPENPYWINIDFPQFNARIFLTYKYIGGKALYKIKQRDGTYRDSTGINQFDRMVNDHFNLTNKNESVASSIKDSLFQTPNGITGVYSRVGGNAATARRFFMSDTVRNFILGALYFNATPNVDSLKPALDFLQRDIDHLINTFKWIRKPAH